MERWHDRTRLGSRDAMTAAAASRVTRLSKRGGGAAAVALSSLLVGTTMVAVPPVASAWKDCSISPQDEWRQATEPTPARRMRNEYERRYTCNNEEGNLYFLPYFFFFPLLFLSSAPLAHILHYD